MVPPWPDSEVEKGEAHKHGQGDDLLKYFELVRAPSGASPTIGWHHDQVFKKRDAPAREDGLPKRRRFEAQMPVPRKRHEDIAGEEQKDGQPIGWSPGPHRSLPSQVNRTGIPRDAMYSLTWRTVKSP